VYNNSFSFSNSNSLTSFFLFQGNFLLIAGFVFRAPEFRAQLGGNFIDTSFSLHQVFVTREELVNVEKRVGNVEKERTPEKLIKDNFLENGLSLGHCDLEFGLPVSIKKILLWILFSYRLSKESIGYLIAISNVLLMIMLV
jgi:hypothetical protein